MKFVLIIASLLALGCIAYEEQELLSRWANFKTIHGKSYTDNSDEQNHYQLWQDNLKFVDGHNALYEAGEVSYYLAQNHLSDLTAAEKKQRVSGICTDCGKNLKSTATRFVPDNSAPLPASVDWRTKNVVNPVKDQEQCGSCWAFSAIVSLEGQYALKNKELKSFSEQEFVDCVEDTSCKHGGLMDLAFQYLESHGLESEQSYPYTGEDGDCKYSSSKAVLKSIKGYQDLAPGDEMALQAAVAQIGPISVAIDATDNFEFYGGGVFNDTTCYSGHFDHGVAVVGYGTEGDKDYYIVRNSWGTSWGDAGYIRMSRNQKNQCGIASVPVFPRL